ncbi:MAG: hypothetical protein ACPG77_10605, partial [Nannocystaceae bacterium]
MGARSDSSEVPETSALSDECAPDNAERSGSRADDGEPPVPSDSALSDAEGPALWDDDATSGSEDSTPSDD